MFSLAYSTESRAALEALRICDDRDPNSGQLLRTLEGPGGGIEWIDWHPRGASDNPHTALNGQRSDTQRGQHHMCALRYSLCCVYSRSNLLSSLLLAGNVLIAGCEDYSAWMWNAADGSCMQVCVTSILVA